MLAVVLAGCAASSAAAETTIEVFTRPGCPHCMHGRAFLERLNREVPGISIIEHDVTVAPAALERLRALSTQAKIATPGVPTFVVGETVLVGFEPGVTDVRLRELVQRSSDPEVAAPTEPKRAVELPWVGPMTFERWGLPLFTLAVGLVDGFNPCATWVLLFLLAMLVNLRDRSRMALIAGTFVVTSGVVYYAFMAAWLTFFAAVGLSGTVRVVLAIIALAMGALNIKDFVAFGRGPSLSIPESAKPGFYRRVRRALHADTLGTALVGMVVLAFLVNWVELLCTAGLPALYTAILTEREFPPWKYHAYLALYIAAYMFDDALMTTLAVVTLRKTKLQERAGRWLKLLSGLVVIALGMLLLLRPHWLGL